MTLGVRRPWEAINFEEMEHRHPPQPEYSETYFLDEPDRIAEVQLSRLRTRAEMAYAVPFFRDRWDAAGVKPSDLRTLDDLWKFPAYTVDDIRKSIDAHPPWGDYQGVTPANARREPIRAFMSGGTTGKSRPTFYTAWDREMGGLLMARQMYTQGLRFGDVVMNSWSYGLHNGAWMYDDALYHWLNCVVLTSSTGNVTSSQKQVQVAIDYQVNAILTTGDYLMRLAEVAREMGYTPKTDFNFTCMPNVGDRALLEETFGYPYYASYGFHEVGTVAVECDRHDGLHVYEDAFCVQVVDPETGEPLPDGELGSLVITELYKTGSPQFRYQIMDLSYMYPPGRCECGSWTRRIGPFAGRGDNMVKLRGVNVWPEALGELSMEVPGVTTDYFVRAVRRDGRDELILSVVAQVAADRRPEVAAQVEKLLQNRIGVKIEVEAVEAGALDAWTEVGHSPKLKRFRDERGADRT